RVASDETCSQHWRRPTFSKASLCVGRASLLSTIVTRSAGTWMFSGVTFYSARRTSFFFFQAEDGIRDWSVTGVQTCALPISADVGDFQLLAVIVQALGQRLDRFEPVGTAKIDLVVFEKHVHRPGGPRGKVPLQNGRSPRSEEHTSELQSLTNLLCPLLLSKKN